MTTALSKANMALGNKHAANSRKVGLLITNVVAKNEFVFQAMQGSNGLIQINKCVRKTLALKLFAFHVQQEFQPESWQLNGKRVLRFWAVQHDYELRVFQSLQVTIQHPECWAVTVNETAVTVNGTAAIGSTVHEGSRILAQEDVPVLRRGHPRLS